MSQTITLKNVRLAYPALFEPKQVMDSEKKQFSAAFLLPTNHPAVSELKATMKKVAKEKWGEKADAAYNALELGGKLCLRNGDLKPDSAGFAGNMFVTASNTTRPTVVDRDRSPLTAAEGRPYGGCYVNVSLEIWAQDNNFGKRINASLRGVQFFKDGEAFSGGGVASEDEFDDLSDGTADGNDDLF